jgi:hypothetical protein
MNNNKWADDDPLQESDSDDLPEDPLRLLLAMGIVAIIVISLGAWFILR